MDCCVFCQTATFSRQKARILRCFTRWRTAVGPSKCNDFGGRKSGTHAAMFSSAAAARLLHVFDAYHVCVCVYVCVCVCVCVYS